MNEIIVYEVRIAFGDGATARELKRRVLAWLAANDYEGIVETMVDGVEIEATDRALAAVEGAGEGEDGLPAAVFVTGDAEARRLQKLLASAFGNDLSVRAEPLAADAWMSAWTPEWKAFATKLFWIMPEGDRTEHAPSLMPIVVKPGEAFGNGQHAATQVMLEALEELAATAERRSLLDVGTGTGILAVAAHRLGYARIVATDLDAPILAEARANLVLNGAAAELLLTDHLPVGQRFSVVVANILVPVLHALMPAFERALEPEGLLLLSGFIAKDEPELVQTARRNGLAVRARHECRGWSCLVLARA